MRRCADAERHGSSPLARGLRLGDEFANVSEGIIPARAGFTPRCSVTSCTHTDHPRSRGVYHLLHDERGHIVGSSPLARGLPASCFLPVLLPADHPRSRGVYACSILPLAVSAGSSPLARGLLSPSQHEIPRSGIIPARAGFTEDFGVGHFEFPDHPRSRGVYAQSSVWMIVMMGSSPLARGLPRECRKNIGPGGGIIPARAGFTARPTRPAGSSTDHPRSRGVYGCDSPQPGLETGSSPLARGLLIAYGIHLRSQGIIPARAGFTFSLAARSSRSADHPRSRGVYGCVSLQSCFLAGSSPLARGLPGGCGSWRQSSQDHPRSRGVYAPPLGYPVEGMGSSPLARGLPQAAMEKSNTERIIPARAGFTYAPPAKTRAWGDHPRSRGVYWTVWTDGIVVVGSSPLARGLPIINVETDEMIGIIPARAGFTRACPPEEDWWEDHPRSRGVYICPGRRIRKMGGSSPLARGLPQRDVFARPEDRIIPARAGFTNLLAHFFLMASGSSPLARGLRWHGLS